MADNNKKSKKKKLTKEQQEIKKKQKEPDTFTKGGQRKQKFTSAGTEVGTQKTEGISSGTRGGISSARTGERLRKTQEKRELTPEGRVKSKEPFRLQQQTNLKKLEEGGEIFKENLGKIGEGIKGTIGDIGKSVIKRSAIAAFGGVAAAELIGLGIGAAETAVGTVLAANKDRAIQKLSTSTGTSIKQLNKIITKKEVTTGINQIIRDASPKTLSSLQKKLITGGALALSSGDVLFQWYALDNVITGQKFFVDKVLQKLKEGVINSDQAIAAVEESREVRQVAIDKVRLSNSINPALWAFRSLILAGVEGDQNAIDLVELEIQQLTGTIQ